MIHVMVDLKGETKTLRISGHANFAPKGRDIVCAAVSAIFQTAILGLKTIAETHPENVEFILNE